MINNSYKLAPWADALYACDLNWWQHNQAVIKQFAGLKITQDPVVSQMPQYTGKIMRVHCDHGVDRLQVGTLGHVGWGGNSGFQAINLAVQFGATRIVLVGYDMRTDRGLHWHPDHPRGMNNPSARNVERWRRVTDEASAVLSALGIEVFNASPVSALRAYPKMGLNEALQGADHALRQNQSYQHTPDDVGSRVRHRRRN